MWNTTEFKTLASYEMVLSTKATVNKKELDIYVRKMSYTMN